MNRAIVDRARLAERPGQRHMQARLPYRDRRTESFVHGALFRSQDHDARQQPGAYDDRPDRGRQQTHHALQDPVLAQIDAVAIAQLRAKAGERRGTQTQQARDEAVGHAGVATASMRRREP